MNGGKIVSRNVVIALGIVSTILMASLVGAIANYTSLINAKDNIIATKNSQIEALASQNSQLQLWLKGNKTLLDQTEKWLQGNITYFSSQISALNFQISRLQIWLEGNKTLLARTQTWLEGNITLLNSLKAENVKLSLWLEENITYYESQIAALNSQMTSLQSEITSLTAEITTLKNTIKDYQAFFAAYQSLIDRVNQRWDQHNIKPFITPQDREVLDIVYSITGGWRNQSDWNEFWKDVKAMYYWVVNNIEYRHDGLYPMLPYNPSETLEFRQDMWQFPNETLSLRQGDCEDMAILLCSMIRCYSNIPYFEVIIIHSSKSAHAAVQILVSNHKLVILDPAGKYYSHDFWGNIVFNDITTEINNWLSYWKPTMGDDVHVSRVFSDYVDRTFTSTNEYIAWMYSR